MKEKTFCQLKSASLLFGWLLLAQTLCALLTLVGAALSLVAMTLTGTLTLSGSTPLWVWLVCGVAIGLFWMAMGWLTPHAARPGPVAAVAVLAVWAALTALMRSADLLLLAQNLCGGMAEQLLQLLVPGFRFDQARALTLGCFLLPAVLGLGLRLGRKRAAAG